MKMLTNHSFLNTNSEFCLTIASSSYTFHRQLSFWLKSRLRFQIISLLILYVFMQI